MSARALLKAVETRLRSAAILNDVPASAVGQICGIQVDGRPPPGFGQRYYAVHWAGARDLQQSTTADQLDLEHQISVTVTARLGFAPTDRLGAQITTPNDLIDLAEVLLAPTYGSEKGIISGNYAQVMNVANSLIPGTAEYNAVSGGGVTVNGFEQPLVGLGFGPVVRKGKDWILSKEDGDVYAIEVRFGKARRLQI